MLQVILTVAGSDSSGGAGLQADLRAIAACGGYGASVVTAITAQNTRGVLKAWELGPEQIEAQLEAVFTDLRVGALKSGMLGSAPVIERLARAIRHYQPPHYVLDPVMISKSGHALLAPDALVALRRGLLPLATLVTPNRHEALALTGIDAQAPGGAERAGRALLEQGAQAVLIKGGHLESADAVDTLVTRAGCWTFAAPRHETLHTHGTGCTLSAAIATYLGRGATLERAVELAKMYVTEAIRDALPLGSGAGPTDHLFYLRRQNVQLWLRRLQIAPGAVSADLLPRDSARDGARVGQLHVITDEVLQQRYSHAQLAHAAARGGADVVQYRDKRRLGTEQRRRAIDEMCGVVTSGVQVIVNDRVDLAVATAADGVHLGRNDEPAVEARRVLGAGAVIGATANNIDEARACFALPVDYLGVGPVYGTASKQDPAPLLGLAVLAQIASESPVPVIAIGGIRPEHVDAVLATGAHGIAVLSAVASADDPERATAAFRAAFNAACLRAGQSRRERAR